MVRIPVRDLNLESEGEFERIERALAGEDFDKSGSYRFLHKAMTNGEEIDPITIHEDGSVMDGFHRVMMSKYLLEKTGDPRYASIDARVIKRGEQQLEIYENEVKRIENQEENKTDDCIAKKMKQDGMTREKAVEECKQGATQSKENDALEDIREAVKYISKATDLLTSALNTAPVDLIPKIRKARNAIAQTNFELSKL